MKACAISLKQCWRDSQGHWFSSGGFPLQMNAIRSLFDEMDLIVVETKPKDGGLPLSRSTRVIALQEPAGVGSHRKLWLMMHVRQYLSAIARQIRQADVVHVPLPGDIPLLAMLLALLARKPLLVRYGGSWATTGITTLTNRFTRGCMRRFANHRNVMLVTGGGSIPPAPGVHWIFSTALSRDELRAIRPVLDRGLSNTPTLIYAGRLSSEKGVAHAIHALGFLKSQGLDPMPLLTIAGDGPERPALENLCRTLGCREHVRFRGQLNRAELSRAFQEADICIQPSLTEGFSKAWLDAMAHGLPILATTVGAAASVIGEMGERGWLVPPGDAQALAGALQRIITNPSDWPALRGRCRSYTESRTLEVWAQEIGRICAARWQCSFIDGKLAA